MTITLGSEIAPAYKAKLNINNKTLCFASATPLSTREIVTNSDQNICGDIDPSISRAQKGRKIIGWRFALDLTWPIAEVVFPLLGITDGSGVNPGPYSLGATDDVVSFPIEIDFGAIVHSIPEAFTSKYAFRGSKGSKPLQMTWDVVGDDEVSGAFVTDRVDFGAEFAFTHGTLTMENDAGTPAYVDRPFDRFLLQVDNKLIVEHNNSITITDVQIGNREAVFATSVPYTSGHDEMYLHYRDDSDGKGSVLVLDNGSKVLTFTMPTGLAIAKPGSLTGKADQIRTPVTMILHRSDNAGTRVPGLTIAVSDPA